LPGAPNNKQAGGQAREVRTMPSTHGRVLLAALAFLLFSGCAATTSVRIVADPEANLASYRTFAFYEELGTDRAQYASIVSERLKAATAREMEARGYVRAESDPDLLINFSGRLQERLRVTQTPVLDPLARVGLGGYYTYRSGLYTPFPVYETDVQEYQEGTLNIDLVDARAKRLVWEGVGVRAVSRKTLENIGPALDETVAAIFARFPATPQ
jgi:hypothetical protein